ncbi:MAG TPA: hypothetical protein VIN60_05170 [Anaerolineales bacterium]
MEDNSDDEINPEEWLFYLTQIMGNEELRDKVFGEISRKTGFPLEKVEIVMKSLLEFLLMTSRSN